MIRAVSWPHAQTIDPGTAITQLQKLSMRLSRSLDPAVQQAAPQVVEVWYEPNTIPPAAGTTAPPDTPPPILVLRGTTTYTPQTIVWATAHQPATLKVVLVPGGRILIRVHCEALTDQKQKQFSASLAPMLGVNGMTLPGGIFESWFFIKGG